MATVAAAIGIANLGTIVRNEAMAPPVERARAPSDAVHNLPHAAAPPVLSSRPALRHLVPAGRDQLSRNKGGTQGGPFTCQFANPYSFGHHGTSIEDQGNHDVPAAAKRKQVHRI